MLDTIRSWGRTHWVDLVVFLVAIAVSWGLLRYRDGLRRKAGGLTRVMTDRAGRARTDRVVQASLFPADETIREVRWSGFLWVPRVGKYVVAIQLAGKGRLELDGRKVLERTVKGQAGGFRGSRGPRWDVVRTQVLLERGWHSLGLTCHPTEKGGCRLLWQAPGRRGSPEYVDPAFLDPGPNPPEADGPPGMVHRDAWTVTGLFLVWFVVIVVWFRKRLVSFIASLRLSSEARWNLVIPLGWFVAALVVRLVLLNRFGQTWDEDSYIGAGRNYWWNLLSFDWREQSWIWNMEHPPVTKYLAGYGALWTDGLVGPRLVFVLLSAGSVAFAWAVGRRLFGEVAAWVGAALLCLSPHLAAHGTIAGHETPSVFFFALAVWALLVAEDHSPKRLLPGPDWVPVRGGWYLVAGISAGLGLSTRWLGAAVLGLLLVWLLVVTWSQLRRGPAVRLDVRALLAPVVAGVVVVAIWPWLWHSPLAHMSSTLGHYGGQVSAPEPFLGRVRQAPWFYFPLYLSATVQPILLFGLAVWGLKALLARRLSDLFIAIWIAIPVFLASLSPLKQDGIRYVLPALVPMAVASGEGLGWLWTLVERWRRRRGESEAKESHSEGTWLVVTVLTVVVSALSLWPFSRMFPYELDYYNGLWGSTSRVCRADIFETGWWGEGLVPTARWVDEHVPKGASLFLEAGARHVFVIRTDIQVVSNPSQADWWVRSGRFVRRRAPVGFSLVHVEAVDGCHLVETWRRKQPLRR